MGVWIETMNKERGNPLQASHPTWVCGLKHRWFGVIDTKKMSHPTWVCGLKLTVVRQYIWND